MSYLLILLFFSIKLDEKLEVIMRTLLMLIVSSSKGDRYIRDVAEVRTRNIFVGTFFMRAVCTLFMKFIRLDT
ncbi:hypothetical protein ACJX0J_008227 [Zea mays]